MTFVFTQYSFCKSFRHNLIDHFAEASSSLRSLSFSASSLCPNPQIRWLVQPLSGAPLLAWTSQLLVKRGRRPSAPPLSASGKVLLQALASAAPQASALSPLLLLTTAALPVLAPWPILLLLLLVLLPLLLPVL